MPILPVHTARHEAGHAVLSWMTAVPFDRVTVESVPGSGLSGHMEGNSNSIIWARQRIGGRQAVGGGILCRLIAAFYISEIIDVLVNGLPADVAAARAGAPAPGRPIAGDYWNVQDELGKWQIPIGDRPAIEAAAKSYGSAFVDHAWFRSAVVAVGDQLLVQPTLWDNEVANVIVGTYPAGAADPAPPQPPEHETELAAYYRYLDTGAIPGHELIQWHSARKGLRFLRACGG